MSNRHPMFSLSSRVSRSTLKSVSGHCHCATAIRAQVVLWSCWKYNRGGMVLRSQLGSCPNFQQSFMIATRRPSICASRPFKVSTSVFSLSPSSAGIGNAAKHLNIAVARDNFPLHLIASAALQALKGLLGRYTIVLLEPFDGRGTHVDARSIPQIPGEALVTKMPWLRDDLRGARFGTRAMSWRGHTAVTFCSRPSLLRLPGRSGPWG
jgi:hypothetical protein